MISTFNNSENLLNQALEIIPGGTQTFSKSYTQYPYGVSPFYVSHAEGSTIWDIDGNEYTDFVNGLLAINLGYKDPDVNNAIKNQIDKGVLFSLPDPIELKVAEKIIKHIPSAEMVRFGKNGSDVTAGAIRLARAYTNRDHIIVCGYHGWQDWYIGSTSKDAGVPKATSNLTHKFEYNNISSLEEIFTRYPGDIAAVIMEPTNAVSPQPGFLESVKDLCSKNEVLLIFDEIITCFRFSMGGAQEIYNVVPDLTTLGKGIANGYPLSAIVGKKDIMKLMEDVFFSFTLGGEAVSLAAGLATIEKMEREPVIDTLKSRGLKLMNGVEQLLDMHQVTDFISQSGHPAWSFLNFSDTKNVTLWEIKTLWMQECISRGVICLGTHNMSYAHTEEDIDKLLNVYNDVFSLLSNAVSKNKVTDLLRCEVLKPLFKVR